MQEAPLISVVLATYNGSRYLAEQLDSIFNQTHKNIEVIVCDDRSTDSTPAILQAYAERYNLRYFINERKKGVVQNFAGAMSHATGEYLAFSDQDDVWLPNKLELSLNVILQLEKKSGKATPALVFTDLKVVDESLKCMSDSYWQFMQLNPHNHTLNRILVENVATGCTILTNKANIDLALPIPPQALMHDIWLLLTASCFGNVQFVRQATMLYRQHINNVVGARQTGFFGKLLSGFRKLKENRFSLLEAEIGQAEAFYRQHYQLLQERPTEKKILQDFISLKSDNSFSKKLKIIRHRYYGSTLKKAINVLLRA